MTQERGSWSFQGKDKWGDRGLLCVTAHESGVLFEVEEEMAVNSYNSTFNCTCFVPWSEIGPLLELLQRIKP